jgi:hypothetical protein
VRRARPRNAGGVADSYGPYVAEELIREALYPYPDNMLGARIELTGAKFADLSAIA